MIALKLAPELEAQVRDAAARRGVAADEFVAAAVEEKVQSSQSEAELFRQVQLGLPEAMWQRYHELIEKRRDEVIETAELDELIEITDAIEAANARRMRALGDLSKLRGTTLDAVMFELGITPPQDE